MKIGVLTTSYPSTPDDPAGHFVQGFASWLANNVGDVEVLAAEATDPAARLAEGGLPARIAKHPQLALTTSARLLAAALPRARAWDALVTHWLVPCGAIGDLLARGRRHLAIAHGSDVALLRKFPLGPAFLRRLARRADLVYVSEALRASDAPGRVVAMPHGGHKAPRSDEERAQARAAWALPPVGEGPLVALYLGRLAPEKGVSLLLESLPKEMMLLVAGDGPERRKLEAQACAGEVRFLGPRFGAEKRQLLALADVLIVPSLRDGTPTVIAEARAVDLPIVGTRVGGLPAAIGKAGLCVVPEKSALHETLSGLTRENLRALRDVPPPDWSEIGPRLWGFSDLAKKASLQLIHY